MIYSKKFVWIIYGYINYYLVGIFPTADVVLLECSQTADVVLLEYSQTADVVFLEHSFQFQFIAVLMGGSS